MARIYTLKRKNSIKSAKILEDIFLRGLTLRQGSVLLRYISRKEEYCCNFQFAVGVSKKNIPLAVHRNRIKRQIREIYRLKRPTLEEKFRLIDKSFYLFFIYRNNKKPTFDNLQVEIQGLINQLIANETNIT